jgi:hypothetical protein
MSTGRQRVERRRSQQITLIERRKGRGWLYGQLIVGGVLGLFLLYQLLF